MNFCDESLGVSLFPAARKRPERSEDFIQDAREIVEDLSIAVNVSERSASFSIERR